MGYDLYFMGPSMWTMGENRVSTSMTRKWKVLFGLEGVPQSYTQYGVQSGAAYWS